MSSLGRFSQLETSLLESRALSFSEYMNTPLDLLRLTIVIVGAASVSTMALHTAPESQTSFWAVPDIHPWRLTWNIVMEVWKIIFLYKWVICRFHVNLPGCKWFETLSASNWLDVKSGGSLVDIRSSSPYHFRTFVYQITWISVSPIVYQNPAVQQVVTKQFGVQVAFPAYHRWKLESAR